MSKSLQVQQEANWASTAFVLMKAMSHGSKTFISVYLWMLPQIQHLTWFSTLEGCLKPIQIEPFVYLPYFLF